MPWHLRAVLSIVVIALIAGALTAASMAATAAWGRTSGVMIVVGVWIVLQLFRLGFEYDDGIDFMQLMLPAPFDWGAKVERLVHFWTHPRTWFRAAYLGSCLALVIVVILLKNRATHP